MKIPRSLVPVCAGFTPCSVVLIASLLFAGVAASPAFAAEKDGGFFIETIRIDGLRSTSSKVVISESRLTEGREYSEAELREAVYRIKRLPFVIDAYFSLKKGTQRGRFELVIEVEETAPLFFGTDITAYSSWDSEQGSFSLTAGGRHGNGRSGMFYGSVQKDVTDSEFSEDVGRYSLGYTNYNLFGKPISATVEAAYMSPINRWEYTLGLGFQLPHNQSLRVRWKGTDDAHNIHETPYGEFGYSWSGWDIEAEWRYDTTDDVLFPTRGRFLRAIVSYADGQVISTCSECEPTETKADERVKRASIGGHQYLNLWKRATLGVGGTFSFYESDKYNILPSTHDFLREHGYTVASVDTSFAIDLLRSSFRGTVRDLRWETKVSLKQTTRHFRNQRNITIAGRNSYSENGVSASTSLALRTRWGVFRVSAFYVDGLGLGEF
ncbi:MAG: BamA/TamA family outer membrane protein [bacterium]|nr:BamA/TamA family outer membrane protein [bacterium]